MISSGELNHFFSAVPEWSLDQLNKITEMMKACNAWEPEKNFSAKFAIDGNGKTSICVTNGSREIYLSPMTRKNVKDKTTKKLIPEDWEEYRDRVLAKLNDTAEKLKKWEARETFDQTKIGPIMEVLARTGKNMMNGLDFMRICEQWGDLNGIDIAFYAAQDSIWTRIFLKDASGRYYDDVGMMQPDRDLVYKMLSEKVLRMRRDRMMTKTGRRPAARAA